MADPGHRTRMQRFLSHKWWGGVSGVFAVLAVVVAVGLEHGKEPAAAPPKPRQSVAERDARVENGDCNAQGSDISITCVPPAERPTAEGLEFFQQTTEHPDDTVGEFALTADAPLEEFPFTGNGGFCSARQAGWLRKHGDESASSSMVRFRNAGTSGTILHLSDLRVEELRRSPARPVIWFSCESAGADDGLEAYLDLPGGGSVEVRYPDREEPVPGSAFSFSLAAGEGGWMIAHTITRGEDGGQPGDDYSGRLVATARYGDAERDVTLTLAGKDGVFELPGDGNSRTVRVRPSGERNPPFMCQAGGAEEAGCTAGEIRALLAATP